jgi:hypothetical protein
MVTNREDEMIPKHGLPAQPFKTRDIDQVLTAVSGGLAADVREHIMQAVDAGLRDYLAGVVNLNSLGDLGTPQVMIRVRTFQTILDEFRRLLDERYPSIIERIGLSIGFNFGISLIRILRNANWIPLDFGALLKFWALFDSSAQMGHVSFEYEHEASGEASIDAKINRLFLTIGYGHDEPLRHCNFMVGYLSSTTDVASMLWTRWIRDSIYAKPANCWRSTACTNNGEERDDVTAFQLTLREERFADARDALTRAIDACESDKWIEAMIDARICLESALLRVVSLSAGTRISFGRLLEQLKNVRANMDLERWKLAYAACSEFAHQLRVHNEIAVLGYLFNVWECVREAEEVELSLEQTGLLARAKDKYITP